MSTSRVSFACRSVNDSLSDWPPERNIRSQTVLKRPVLLVTSGGSATCGPNTSLVRLTVLPQRTRPSSTSERSVASLLSRLSVSLIIYDDYSVTSLVFFHSFFVGSARVTHPHGNSGIVEPPTSRIWCSRLHCTPHSSPFAPLVQTEGVASKDEAQFYFRKVRHIVTFDAVPYNYLFMTITALLFFNRTAVMSSGWHLFTRQEREIRWLKGPRHLGRALDCIIWQLR